MQQNRKLVAMLLASLVGMALATASCSPEKRKARYLARGEEAMQKSKYAEASILFRQALQVDPRFVEAYYQLGLASIKLHQGKSAYDALERAAELAPGRIDIHLALADLLFAARQFEECDKEAKIVLLKDPNNVHADQILGESLLARRQVGPAVEIFTRLTQLRPQDPRPYLDIAIAQLNSNNLPEAEKSFKKTRGGGPAFCRRNIEPGKILGIAGQV